MSDLKIFDIGDKAPQDEQPPESEFAISLEGLSMVFDISTAVNMDFYLTLDCLAQIGTTAILKGQFNASDNKDYSYDVHELHERLKKLLTEKK